MNKEQQDKLWNDLSEESKKYVLKNYQENKDIRDKIENWIRREYETLFGSHNLNPEPQIKTWGDIVAQAEWDIDSSLNKIQIAWIGYPICDKMIATAKIAKLIELGYGGMITNAEWEDEETIKFGVKWSYKAKDWLYHNSRTTKHFVAFHTPEQREEFMSHESNRKLVEMYYLM